jgi:hypothetical protein
MANENHPLKYVLIEHAEAGGSPVIRVFDNLADRAKATREAILGPACDDNKDLQCPEIATLSIDGRVNFEGDPPLEWLDAYVIIN